MVVEQDTRLRILARQVVLMSAGEAVDAGIAAQPGCR
jgi:hypothetical protein